MLYIYTVFSDNRYQADIAKLILIQLVMLIQTIFVCVSLIHEMIICIYMKNFFLLPSPTSDENR